MDIFIKTLEANISLFIIGFVGFYVIKRKVLPENVLRVMTPLIIDVALPCLIFSNILKNFEPSKQPGWYFLPVWWLFFMVVNFSVSRVSVLFVAKEKRRYFFTNIFFYNGIFIPVAILSGIFGENSQISNDLFLFILFYSAFYFNSFELFLKKSRPGEKKLDMVKTFNPITISTLLAIAVKLLGFDIYVPTVLVKTLGTVGQISTPLILIIIGGNVYSDFKVHERPDFRTIGIFILFKNVLMPLIMIALVILIRPVYNTAFLLVLASLVPPMTANPILTERYGENRKLANDFLVYSTFTSIFLIPVLLFVFELLYRSNWTAW